MSVAAEARGGPLRWWFGVALWKRILAALVLGAIVGAIWGEGAAQIRWIGDLFIRLARMMVTPLVLVTLAAGVGALGDLRRLGTMGGRTIGLLVLMTALSVAVGLLLGTLIEPGLGVTLAGGDATILAPAKPLGEQLMAIVPVNPIQALANGDMLAIVFFSAMLGVGLLMVPGQAGLLQQALESARGVMLAVVGVVMEAAPLGVFALIAAAIGQHGLAVLEHVSRLAFALLLGVGFQLFVVQAGLVAVVGRLSPFRFFRAIVDAVLMAFSTTSSAAVLPVSMSVAEKRLGISRELVSAGLPLGLSLARDGTAVYVGLLCMFAAQAFGVAVTPIGYASLVLGATLLALGAAGVPSAALFMLTGVLSLIGVSDAQAAMVVGFILPFDRLLDMIRTVPNVTANLAVATAVARLEDGLDPPDGVR
ncbi:MAG: dicarboxylate/amino acid:cation symporter [Pseudomonadota bacterium]